MKTIQLSDYGVVISPKEVHDIGIAVQESVQAGEAVTLDFKNVKGIYSEAARDLLKSMRGHKGAVVQMKNAAPMVKSVMMYSSGATITTETSAPSQKHSFRLWTLLLLLTLGVGQMWGEWSDNYVTFYVAVGENHTHYDNDCRTFYSNIKRGDNDWEQIELTRTDYTYNGKTVYQGTHNFGYGGYNNWQFYIKDGSSNNQKSLEWYAGDWKTNLHNGEVWDWTGTETADKSEDHWKTATWDDSYTVYFARTTSWDYGTPYFYGWNGNCDNNAWPGTAMDELSGKTFNGKKIYTITVGKRYANCKFSNNGSNETGNFNLYGTNDGKMYYWDGSADQWVTLQYDVTLDRQSGATGSTSIVATCGSAMPSATMPTRSGYTFAGYYTGTSGSGTKYYNADGTSTADWPSDGTGPTTLYAHWTQDPGVATLTAAGNATELWIGVNASAALTFTATSSNVSSGTAVTWSLTDNTGDCTVSTTTSSYSGATFSYTPGSTGAKTITVTMTIGGNNYTKTYNLTVYERWNIYVRDDVDNWGTMYLHLYDNSTGTSKSTWPGDECSSYNSSAKWYTVTLDSKYPHFILNNNNSGKQLLGSGSIATNKATYTPGSYWKTVWNSDGTGGDSGKKFYTLTSATITDPVVTITRCDVYSTYALLEGNVTGFGGDGSALSDLKEYGFYIGETENTSIQSTSGTRFRVKVKGLTPGNTYNIKAFATNIDNTAYSDIQSKTASNASRTIGVRYPNATDQTLKLYAFRDIPADYGEETVKNADWSGVTLTRRAGTSRWWETTVTNAADYEYFIVSNNGNKQTNNIGMPNSDACWWYNDSPDDEHKADRSGSMDCPFTTPQLYINATAGATDYAYNEMSTSPSISKTMSLSAGTYTFKIMYNAEWYGKNSDNTISRTGATTSNAVSGMTIDQGYITLTADFAGDYIFTFDPSTNTVSVTYPTAYVVTYSKSIVGTDNSTTAAPSAAYTTGATAVTSGDLVLDGTGVTFTAAAAGTGYTWKGWYTVADPSADYTANRVATTAEYATTISAATTIYAVYEEDMHTVTVTAGEHGSITTPASGTPRTVQAGIATSASIGAAAEYGYYFRDWTIVGEGSVTFDEADDENTTINATTEATIQANFVSHWSIVGGDSETSSDGPDAMGNWELYVNGIESFVNVDEKWIGHVDIVLPANTTFYFKVRDLYDGSAWYGNAGEMTYGNSTNLSMTKGSSNCRITTAGAGTYTFTWNETNETLTVTYPDSYTVTYGKVADNGQDIGSVTVTGDDAAALETGKYVAKGTATFTAADAANYTFIEWRTSSTYGEGTQLSTENPFTMTDIAENKTVYAHYAENMTSVTLAATNGKIQYWDGDSWEDTPSSKSVGVFTTCSIKAVPNTGYYFAGWVNTAGSDYSITGAYGSESNNNTTLSGLGAGETTGQTLTANFVELDKIYFRNENEETGGKLWDVSKMYVYYNVGWGTVSAADDGVTTAGSSQAEMNPISAESNIYWAYVPRSFTTGGNGQVAFSNVWMGSSEYPESIYGEFHQNEAVYRTDYDTNLNMYVPSTTYTESNSTKYYNDGFWMKYNTIAGQGASYYLKENTGSGELSEFKIDGANSTSLYTQYRFENTSAKTFYIANAAGNFYDAVSNVTSINCTDINLEFDATPEGFTITPTAEGYYTIYIDQSGNTMKISVNYPISAGDYRLDYTHDTNKHLYSDIIKPDNTSSITNIKKSVYIDPETAGGSLKLQKCTSLDPSTKQPIWTSGVSVGTLSTVFINGKGVYEFDMTIDNTGKENNEEVASVDLSNVKIYEGPFYIKTDYAPGHWVNYKENVLNKNTITFDTEDPKTFDYYHCAWVGDGEKNVKCIIANEYNEQITDTLIGDDILGKMEDGTTPRQYLAYAANVRFSYNSVTNELKRTYINGATDWQESFLLLSAAEGNIRSAYGEHPDFTGNDTTLTDNNNWIYMKDIQAREGARVKLTANYRFSNTDHIQYLVGEAGDYTNANTKLILGGSTPADWHTIRVIYDFKTNKLISAWLADGTAITGTRAIETDVLVVRTGQSDPTQITLTSTLDQLTEVDTVYSALCLTKDYLNDGTKTDSERRYYWVSFPYNVKISDIFGSFGEYGKYWIFQRYDGRKRAQYGFWAESSSNWEYITDKSTILNAYEGYVLTLDLAEYNSSNEKFWGNDVTQIYEYFPSMSRQSSIEYAATKPITINQDGYQCTIDRSKEVHNGRELGPEYDRTVRDSYWHLIGVPSYAQTSGNAFNDAESGGGWISDRMPFFYSWNMSENKLSAKSTTASDPFMPMRAYLVQYSGTTITWNAVSASPSPIVARRQASGADIHFAEFNLNLLRDNQHLDHTYVRLTDNEDATSTFEFGQDLCKEFQNGANIYTMIDQLEVAGNSLPLSNQTTVVPVGVKINESGEYTFAMPDGTEGIGVVLIDNIAGTRTNLGLMDYTVTLSQGKIDGRFALEISPIAQTPTDIDKVQGDNVQGAKARKVMIDGILYIVKDGKVFDARGGRVE